MKITGGVENGVVQLIYGNQTDCQLKEENNKKQNCVALII